MHTDRQTDRQKEPNNEATRISENPSPKPRARINIKPGSSVLNLTVKRMDTVQHKENTQQGTKANTRHPPPLQKGGVSTATPSSENQLSEVKNHKNHCRKVKYESME